MKSLLRATVAVMTLSILSFAGTVSVTSPANGATVSSPAKFVASATSTHPITVMRIYVDNSSVYSVKASSINTSVAMSTGKHSVVVQAWDTSGAVTKTPLSITVASTTTSTAPVVSTPASGATVTSP